MLQMSTMNDIVKAYQKDADGPEDLLYPPDGHGAGKNSSVWAHGQCPCASEDDHKKAEGLPPDATRFYIGGPVSGGTGRRPVLGKDYIQRQWGAINGQRYAGAYVGSATAGKPSPIPTGFSPVAKIVLGASEKVDLVDLMERLQQFIYQYRIRAKDFFMDFDPLNRGCLSANRFRRCLYSLGIGAMGRMNMTEAEFDALINFYRLENDPSLVCWRKFDTDIESIFLQKGIERIPSLLTPSPKRIVELPRAGTVNMNDVPLRIRQLAKCAVARLRHRVIIESCNIKYFFQGFDRQNTGHVSRQQFKQVLSMLNYYFSVEELDAMAVKYGNNKGFNYLKLMDDIEPKPADPGWYQKYKAGRLYQLSRPPAVPKWQENDLRRILYKMQTRMVCRRPKLYDFLRDHDLFSHDRLKIINFHRALDRAGFELTPREMEVLTCCFRSPDDDTEIEWRCFLQAIEIVFTLSNLEKGPRIVPQEWHPLRAMNYDKELTEDENCLLVSGMRRLAQRSYNRRLEFKPMFLDFDKPHTGLVSQDQFHRVMHTIGLADITTLKEFEAILKRYEVYRGGKRDIDYVAFLFQLDLIPYTCPITLEEMSPTGVKWHQQTHPIC